MRYPMKRALFLTLLLPGLAFAGKAFDVEHTSSAELIEYLDHGAWEFRYDAARELERRCVPQADEKLAALVELEPNNKVRLAAMVTLEKCKHESALLAAETMSLVDSEDSHRQKAIAIIEKLGNERSGPVLSQVLKGDPEEDVRLKAAKVLRKRAWKGAEPVQEEIARRDPSRELRQEAVLGLMMVDPDRYRPLLHELLTKDADERLRRELVEWIEKRPKAADKDALVLALDDVNPHVARHAARALVRLGDRSVAEVLREKALHVADRKVAEEFSDAAARLGG